MNQQLGTKWFTFYTKIRPWIACFTALGLIIDFFQYTDVYLGNLWALLYLATGIAGPILAIIVFNKSSGNYEDFVDFVKGVLIFETISIPYQAGVQQYIKNWNIGVAVAVSLILLIIVYFTWYRLNVKYFENRILKEAPKANNYNPNYNTQRSQFSSLNQNAHTYGNYSTYDNGIGLNTQKNFSEMHAEAPKIQFCRKCGVKLPEDALFCTQCGTKVITDCTVNNNTNINTSAPITNVHNTTQDKNLNRSINKISNESWMCSCGARNNDRSCSVCFKPRPLNSANITSNLPFRFTQDTISNNIPNDKQSEHIPTMQNLINESWVCSCGARNNGRSCSVCYKPRPTQK